VKKTATQREVAPPILFNQHQNQFLATQWSAQWLSEAPHVPIRVLEEGVW